MRDLTTRLTKEQATEAAHKLLEIAQSKQQWNITIATAESCLPKGWDLRGAAEGIFRPPTITNFVATYRAHARPWSETR
jgi:hypothetical protein